MKVECDSANCPYPAEFFYIRTFLGRAKLYRSCEVHHIPDHVFENWEGKEISRGEYEVFLIMNS